MARKKISQPVVEQTHYKGKSDFIVWQGYTEGESIGEAALHIKACTDVISIKQGSADVLVNYESVDMVIALLQRIKKNKRLL
jgi:hypothetical protein